MTIYATQDYDGERIEQNAHIAAFETMDDARAYLLTHYAVGEWDISTAVIEPGGYGDCWIKSTDAPSPDSTWITPFTFDQLYVQRPGQHPGGQRFWTTPTVDVLIVVSIHEVEVSNV